MDGEAIKRNRLSIDNEDSSVRVNPATDVRIWRLIYRRRLLQPVRDDYCDYCRPLELAQSGVTELNWTNTLTNGHYSRHRLTTSVAYVTTLTHASTNDQ